MSLIFGDLFGEKFCNETNSNYIERVAAVLRQGKRHEIQYQRNRRENEKERSGV